MMWDFGLRHMQSGEGLKGDVMVVKGTEDCEGSGECRSKKAS